MATKNKLLAQEKEKLAAELLQKGETEEKENNYKEALEYYQQAASLGSSEAIKNIGNFYRDGHAVEIDYKLAMKYFQGAAKLGNAKAMNNIGCLYFYGSGVKNNYKKAEEWYRKAAEFGNVDAMYNLGYMYYETDFYEYNVELKKEVDCWLHKAAEFGNAEAMFLFAKNSCDYSNYEEQQKWYRKAAEAGHAEAMYEISQDLVYSNIKTAFKLCKQAAERGCVKAMFSLSEFYNGNYGFCKNKEKEYKWLKKAAEAGDTLLKKDIAEKFFAYGKYKYALEIFLLIASSKEEYEVDIQSFAMGKIGQIYYIGGDGIKKDYVKAKEWFKKGRDWEHLGDLYYYGKGVEQDYLLALYYYQEACNSSNYDVKPLMKIADMYYYGQGVKRSCIEAKKYYEKAIQFYDEDAICKIGNLIYDKVIFNNFSEAMEYHKHEAAKGNIEAMYYIGCLYYYGKGVKVDRNKAAEWYKKAADLNFSDAMVALSKIDNSKILLEKAANLSNGKAFYDLGQLNISEKEEMYKLAIKAGYAEAGFELPCSKYGIKYKKQSAKMGYIRSMAWLYWYYFQKNDKKNAKKWENAMKIHII